MGITVRRRVLAVAVAVVLAATASLACRPAEAGYRGFTDQHMSWYVGANRVITIEDGLGGHVQGMLRILSRLAYSRKRVVIDGPCRSACTLLLSLGPSRVCLTRRAELWFHQATLLDGKRSRFWSNAMLALYPPAVRRYVRRRGGLSRKWMVVKGRRLHRLFPSRCQSRKARASRSRRAAKARQPAAAWPRAAWSAR